MDELPFPFIQFSRILHLDNLRSIETGWGSAESGERSSLSQAPWWPPGLWGVTRWSCVNAASWMLLGQLQFRPLSRHETLITLLTVTATSTDPVYPFAIVDCSPDVVGSSQWDFHNDDDLLWRICAWRRSRIRCLFRCCSLILRPIEAWGTLNGSCCCVLSAANAIPLSLLSPKAPNLNFKLF